MTKAEYEKERNTNSTKYINVSNHDANEMEKIIHINKKDENTFLKTETNCTVSLKNGNTTSLSDSSKMSICKKLEILLGNLTDFDISVSKLREDFMSYTKKNLNEKNKTEELANNKTSYLVSYSEKMNDLNHTLQKFRLEIFSYPNKEQCTNKASNRLEDVHSNFVNLVKLFNHELGESKVPVSFLMINLEEKNSAKLR